MKTTFFLIAGLIAIAITGVKAQDNRGFKLTGNLQGWPGNRVYVYIDKKLDSTQTDNKGNFEFKGNIKEPGMSSFYVVVDGKPRYCSLWLGNYTMQLKGKLDSVQQMKLIGSPDQDIFEAWQKLASATAPAYYLKYNEAKERKDSVAMKSEKKLADAKWGPEYNRLAAKEIGLYPKSPVAIYHLRTIVMSKDYKMVDSLATLMEKNGAQQKDLKSVHAYAIKMSQMKTMAIGVQAPDFSVPDVNGKQITLNDFKGKYVLLDFWASWCIPCRKENPNVLKAYNQFKGKGLEILAVSLDKSKELWLQAIKEDGLPWTQVSDLKGGGSDVALKYGVTAIPSNFLIDPSGKIVALSLRGEALANKLQEIF